MTAPRVVAALTALLVAVVAFGVAFGVVELAALYLLRWMFEVPGNPSTGDSAGWGFLISQPVTALLGIAAGLTAAILAYGTVSRRLGQ